MKKTGRSITDLKGGAYSRKVVAIYRENPAQGITADDFPERLAEAERRAGPGGQVIIITCSDVPPE
jgi:hypothetical protein